MEDWECRASFKDKVVVVSGGSRGIGRGIALAFAREGAQTVLASSSERQSRRRRQGDRGRRRPEPLTVAGDLRKLAGCEQVFERVNERFKRCDILVNNAGATRAGNFLDLPDEAWLDGFALKFFGAVRLTRLFWPLLKAAQGHVVNIIGGAARTVGAGIPDRRLGQCRRSRTSPRGCPSSACATASTSTPSIPATPRPSAPKQLLAAARGRAGQDGRGAARRGAGQERHRAAWRRPRTSPTLTLFLCSERARHIQGTAIAVDGGATPGLY